MPPQRPRIPTSLPHLEVLLTDDGSRTLFDSRLDETYHSGCGALSECLVVYLRNSGIEQLLTKRGSPSMLVSDKSAEHSTDSVVRVLEVGFGTGMAWLLTAALAEACECKLEYISLEHRLLPLDILQQMQIGQSVDDAIAGGQLTSQFAAAREIESKWLGKGGLRMVHTEDLDSNVADRRELCWAVSDRNHLQIVLGDARDYLLEHDPQTPLTDAIYFDAFSPATNPELWNEECFSRLCGRLKPDGVLVSYCVKGVVRRALENVGFTVDRLPGPPGGKREVLVAKRK